MEQKITEKKKNFTIVQKKANITDNSILIDPEIKYTSPLKRSCGDLNFLPLVYSPVKEQSTIPLMANGTLILDGSEFISQLEHDTTADIASMNILRVPLTTETVFDPLNHTTFIDIPNTCATMPNTSITAPRAEYVTPPIINYTSATPMPCPTNQTRLVIFAASTSVHDFKISTSGPNTLAIADTSTGTTTFIIGGEPVSTSIIGTSTSYSTLVNHTEHTTTMPADITINTSPTNDVNISASGSNTLAIGDTHTGSSSFIIGEEPMHTSSTETNITKSSTTGAVVGTNHSNLTTNTSSSSDTSSMLNTFSSEYTFTRPPTSSPLSSSPAHTATISQTGIVLKPSTDYIRIH